MINVGKELIQAIFGTGNLKFLKMSVVITYNFSKILEKYLQTSSIYFLVIFLTFQRHQDH